MLKRRPTARFAPAQFASSFTCKSAEAAGMLYDVSPGGRRFVFNTRIANSIAPVTAILNWTNGLTP